MSDCVSVELIGRSLTLHRTSRADRTSLGFSNEPAVQFDGESTVQYGPDFKIPVQELGRFEDLSGLALMLITNRYM